MRVFLIGGTGFLGNRLSKKLLDNGHEITVLTRSREKAANLENKGISAITGDLLKPELFVDQVSNQDVVISVAMPDVRPSRISSRRFRFLREQTTTYFNTYLSLAKKLDCPLILTLGTSFRTKGSQVADESWPIDRFGITRIGEYVDPLIEKAMIDGSPPLIQMLPGEIYGPGGIFRNFMYEWMKKGRYRVIGSGDNYIPRINVDDCAGAYIKVLGKMPLGEKYIIADDMPCTQREFTDIMADYMKKRRPKSIPGLLVRIAMGKFIYETVKMNCLVSNTKAKTELNWELKYPTIKEGLPAVIQEIEGVNMQKS